MLHRAANNAYSWWWASHIRTKQSKWLEQNLQDMDEKVNNTLKIINNDGDSFAQRAEMYYRKRPELVNYVEESYRQYRALAERYDHLSREMQSANRTIATVFPEQVQFAMDDEDEENLPQASTSSNDVDKTSKNFPAIPKPSIPNVPKVPKKDFRSRSMLMSRKGQQLKRTASSTKSATTPSSGLSKSEALEEIDKLQKGILALQTEKEFMKSSYEHGYAKYWEIENLIIEMQNKVCSLQDQFGIGTVIDDNDARSLMAATALKSCQETLVKLQEKQEQFAEEARVEHRRIKEAHEKFVTLKEELLSKQRDHRCDPTEEHQSVSTNSELKNLDQQISSVEQERHQQELLQEKIKEQLAVNSNSPVTVTQLAEKIDELVDKVVKLETTVSSQTGLVKKLRSETDELQAHIRSLAEDKETLIEGSDNMSNKLRELEEELHRIKNLNQHVADQNYNLQTQFTEASCNIEHLSEKLRSVKLDEEVENPGLFQEVRTVPDAKPDKGFRENEAKLDAGDILVVSEDNAAEKEEEKDNVLLHSNSVEAEGENLVEPDPCDKVDVMSKKPQEPVQEEKDEELSETVEGSLESEPEEMGTEEEEDQPNWRKLFINGLEDREKILLEEYTSVFQNYKEVRRKLTEVEKKNRDGLFELAMQIRELNGAVASRDEEIQRLKPSSLQKHPDDNSDVNSTEYRYSNQEGHPQVPSSLDSSLSFQSSRQHPLFHALGEQNVEFKERIGESTTPKDLKRLPTKEEENKIKHVNEPRAVSTIEEKIRSEIDELLEENLEFWLRFSTSFHQIQKFQTSIQDLKAELSKLKQDGSTKQPSLNSDARPIYKHMREIQTELTLWLENNAILKDELQGRYSSLCNIHEDITSVSNAGSKALGSELSEYQAAKFQGEVRNMKQESNKVADELQAGLDRVRGLQVEVEKTLAKLDEDLGISASKNHHSRLRSSSSRPRIPLRSFLFGVKLKKQKQQKQSIFSCINPALQKQYSDLEAAGLPR